MKPRARWIIPRNVSFSFSHGIATRWNSLSLAKGRSTRFGSRYGASSCVSRSTQFALAEMIVPALVVTVPRASRPSVNAIRDGHPIHFAGRLSYPEMVLARTYEVAAERGL